MARQIADSFEGSIKREIQGAHDILTKDAGSLELHTDFVELMQEDMPVKILSNEQKPKVAKKKSHRLIFPQSGMYTRTQAGDYANITIGTVNYFIKGGLLPTTLDPVNGSVLMVQKDDIDRVKELTNGLISLYQSLYDQAKTNLPVRVERFKEFFGGLGNLEPWIFNFGTSDPCYLIETLCEYEVWEFFKHRKKESDPGASLDRLMSSQYTIPELKDHFRRLTDSQIDQTITHGDEQGIITSSNGTIRYDEFVRSFQALRKSSR